MSKSPTSDRVLGIFNGLVIAVIIGLPVMLGATLLHVALRYAFGWSGKAMTKFWIPLFMAETLGTFYILNEGGDYREPDNEIVQAMLRGDSKLKQYYGSNIRAVKATLFFMFSIITIAGIVKYYLEDSHVKVSFWILLLVGWLFFVYTEIIREFQKNMSR